MKALTENKIVLLNLFVTNPQKSFYMQEIGRILGKKPGTFQRALNTMVAEGILQSEYKANARYFRINRQYSLYSELKNIVSKTAGIQSGIREVLAKLKAIHYAFIYGSFAKNKTHAASDIDLLIVGNPDEDALIAELDRLEGYFQREINYHLYSPQVFQRVVQSKDPFVLEVLKDKKIMLIGSADELRPSNKK